VAHQKGEHRYDYYPDQGDRCSSCDYFGTDVHRMVLLPEEYGFCGVKSVLLCTQCRCDLIEDGVKMRTWKSYRRMDLGEKDFRRDLQRRPGVIMI